MAAEGRVLIVIVVVFCKLSFPPLSFGIHLILIIIIIIISSDRHKLKSFYVYCNVFNVNSVQLFLAVVSFDFGWLAISRTSHSPESNAVVAVASSSGVPSFLPIHSLTPYPPAWTSSS